ncbi:MAG: hypothetical protein CGU28_02965 [Candidatus Dactylopiibacterium carminicum]|nr:MAG: hypothetical protein CGU28_02965 [Candidatus Dactylopiibacterium carminicum]
MLLKRHGPTVQREFGRMAGLDKSWISRIVERFVADGLVERLPLETDRRCLVLHLTAAGEAEASRFDVMLNEQALKLFESIPAGEYPGLDASLMTLMDALRPLAVRKER